MPAPDFTLRDQSGRAVSPHRFHGEVALLAFVSATCGATCVLFGDQIRGALDELARPIPVLLVSLDPAADSAARTTAFLARTALSARARYLSGPPQQLAEVWRAYGLHPIPGAHGRRERAPRVLLLDRSGRVRVIFELEQLTPEGLAHDVRKLLAG
jgi:protein SCO1/2